MLGVERAPRGFGAAHEQRLIAEVAQKISKERSGLFLVLHHEHTRCHLGLLECPFRARNPAPPTNSGTRIRRPPSPTRLERELAGREAAGQGPAPTGLGGRAPV